MSRNPHLPEEIMTNILTYLPAKSIGKFRCVSKLWLSILTNHNFIKAHLKHHKQEEKLLLISHSDSLHTLTLTSQNDGVSRKLDFPPHLDSKWLQIVGSCNGLVLAVKGDEQGELMFLINPTTLEQVLVPSSPLALPQPVSSCMHGLGYDDINDDYKVVTLSYYDSDNEYEPDIVDTFVDVYSLKRGLWRRLESSPYDHADVELASGVFVHGAIHWLASKKTNITSVIAAFDLANEKFREVPAPNGLDEDMFEFNKLVVLEGCLCKVVDQNEKWIDVWMMKKYGVDDSWIKLIRANETLCYYTLKPLCLVGDHEVVLEVNWRKLILYDFKEERSRDIVLDGAPAMFRYGLTVVESLVSPKLFEEQ